MYKVIADFSDLQDDAHKYFAGDVFPRGGIIVSASRIRELSTTANRRGMPMIEYIPEEPAKTSESKRKGKK